MRTAGIHHITAIAGDPQKNIDFYTKMLGLRFVKQTVNFDDPSTYHFYFADSIGTPGTVLTFFPWPGASAGRPGAGQAISVGFSIPKKSMGFWLERLITQGIEHQGPETRFGERLIRLTDPDGLPLELIAADQDLKTSPWTGSEVTAEHAIRGFHSTLLWEENPDETAQLLKNHFGYERVDQEGNLLRLRSGAQGPGGIIDIQNTQEFWRGAIGTGTIHHVALRAEDERVQRQARDEIAAAGLRITPQIDRKYFKSVYFREPGGVLFEIATDGPGFTVDESPENLGTTLQIPPQYASQSEQIKRSLPPIRLPGEAVHAPANNSEAHLTFIHHWVPRTTSKKTLLLLHGTGGTEHDLIPLGRQLDPGAALLAPRGQVLENGMARFFVRLAPGVFDETDLKQRTHQMAHFIQRASRKYSFDLESTVLVGYSNGANFAASLIFLYPQLFKSALLFRPMLPFEPDPLPNLSRCDIYLSLGIHDPAVPRDRSEPLLKVLERALAKVRVRWENAGHEISPPEIEAAGNWIKGLAQ